LHIIVLVISDTFLDPVDSFLLFDIISPGHRCSLFEYRRFLQAQ